MTCAILGIFCMQSPGIDRYHWIPFIIGVVWTLISQVKSSQVIFSHKPLQVKVTNAQKLKIHQIH